MHDRGLAKLLLASAALGFAGCASQIHEPLPPLTPPEPLPSTMPATAPASQPTTAPAPASFPAPEPPPAQRPEPAPVIPPTAPATQPISPAPATTKPAAVNGESPKLSIPTTVLATRVEGFGVYEPLDTTLLTADHEISVVLYCEVAGLASRMGDRRMYESRLRQENLLVDATGNVIWTERSNSIPDYSRSRRRDFYVARVIRLPRLNPGEYTLKMTITDQLANRSADAALPLHIGK